MKLRVPFAENTLKETIVPFHVQQALMVFHHRPPTDDELTTLPHFLMTPRDPGIPPGHVSSNKDIIPCTDPTQLAYHAVSDIIRQACPSHTKVLLTVSNTPVGYLSSLRYHPNPSAQGNSTIKKAPIQTINTIVHWWKIYQPKKPSH
jgi:hypothetical protein